MHEVYGWVEQAYGNLSMAQKIGIVGLVAVVTTAGGLAVIVALPADHFQFSPTPDSWSRRHRIVRWTLVGLKNVAGAILLPLGIFMAVPLVPGPGLVFILLGLSLLDFPGKHALQRRLLVRPGVSRFLNNLRAAFKKPPFAVDPD